VPVCLFYKLIFDITLRAFSSPLQEKAKLSSILRHFTPALRGSGRTWYFFHVSAPHDASTDNWFLFCSQVPSAAAAATADRLCPHTFFLCACVYAGPWDDSSRDHEIFTSSLLCVYFRYNGYLPLDALSFMLQDKKLWMKRTMLSQYSWTSFCGVNPVCFNNRCIQCFVVSC